MHTDCPKCGFEDCFFNGVSWECPDCGYEWGSISRKKQLDPVIITLDDGSEK